MTAVQAPETPTAASAQLESVPCAVCGSDAFEVVIPSRRDPTRPVDLQTVFRSSGDEPLQDQMVRCTTCGLHYVRPRLKLGADPRGLQGRHRRELRLADRVPRAHVPRCLDKIERMARAGGEARARRRRGRRLVPVRGARARLRAATAASRARGCASSPASTTASSCIPGTIFDTPVKPGTRRPAHPVRRHRAHAGSAGGAAAAPTSCWRRAACSPCPIPTTAAWPRALLGSRWPFLLTVHLYYFTPQTMTAISAPHRLRAAGLHAAPPDPRDGLRRRSARRRTSDRWRGRAHGAAARRSASSGCRSTTGWARRWSSRARPRRWREQGPGRRPRRRGGRPRRRLLPDARAGFPVTVVERAPVARRPVRQLREPTGSPSTTARTSCTRWCPASWTRSAACSATA